MWKAQMPVSNRTKAAGLPLLQNVKHHYVYQPANRKEGALNHYATLHFHNGHFHAMWGNHTLGEDGPGQRILYSSSKDGTRWTRPIELFPKPCPIAERGKRGLRLKPDYWVEADGKLYAVIYASGHGPAYMIAREVTANGNLGNPFMLYTFPANAVLPEFMSEPVYNPEVTEKIFKWYEDNDVVSWWARRFDNKYPSRGIDGADMIESFTFRDDYGLVLLYRDFGTVAGANRNYTVSNRIYASFEDGKGGWTIPYPTDIPDSHSRSQARRLPDGSVLLVGNQIAHRFDEGLRLPRDPLTLAISMDGQFFTKVFALRTDAPRTPRFSGIAGGRDIGMYGYPSMIVHNGMVYVLYSVSKEDIAISIVPLSWLH